MRKGLVALLFLSPLACGDDDVGDSADGWRAASTVLASSQSEFQAEIENGLDGSVTVSCPDGGSVKLSGRYAGEEDFEFAVEYDNCVCHDVRMNGELSLSGSAEVSSDRVEVVVSYDGELTWSGAANGTCEVSMDARVAAQTSGSSASSEVEFKGSICGYDAEAVVRAATDLD